MHFKPTGFSRRLAITLALAGMTSAAAPVWAQQPQAASDGVQVGKMSSLRNLVPEEQLEAAATQQYVAIKQQAQQQNILLPENHPQVKRLRAIANKIIPQVTRWNPRASDWKWEINVIAAKDVNAFCMPGGKIAFFTGLLDGLQLTDDEVAIVMGHEIAHALREHGRERVAKSTLTNAGAKLAGIGLSALLGIDSNLTTAATGLGANLTMLKFSRDDETEADVVGLDIAARAGYDPRAGVALWQKMAKVSQNASPQWLSSHPAGQNRITEMKKHLPAVMPVYARTKGVALQALPPYRSNVKGIDPVS
ncbi:peptidase M48-like protein [Paucimonas lemoignei]|uniref:Peptidase M48-like protein n=1 Tax=Paucimonas lemoignei TaxID=29443 RepID=A0A4R3HX46_PAULE|nr:M48 family metallopeptidase [Paucimonas lemoignei]TCS37887.1 peptidase M48-like protein [Paucimonas lemoignei]